MRAHPMVLLLFELLMAACADGNGFSDRIGPSTDGTLLVSTSTGGGEPDQDGYLLAVDGADSVSLEPTGTVAIALPTGRHALRLLDVADQCSVASDTALEVDLPSRDTVRVAFDVRCPAAGALITVTTTGLDIDTNGYRVLVDGAERAHIQPTQTVLTQLEPGSRTIALTDLSPNCTTAGPASRTVTVVVREVVSIEFAVACTATSGVVGILIRASGPIVHESFEPMLDGGPFKRESPRFPGDMATFMPGLRQYLTDVPAGDHVISLLDSPHCSVETAAQPASVTAGDTVEVDFSARCSLPQDSSGTLRISTPTTGRTPPSTRYTLRYAVAGYWDYGSGELTFLSTVEPNGTLVTEAAVSGVAGGGVYWYEFALEGAPTNCSVRSRSPSPSHPLGYKITAGDTLDIEFVVTCPP